jgi:hypothetical protein
MTELTLTRPAVRLAGVLYLAIICLGLWSEVGVRLALVVPGEAAATAANLRAEAGLVQLGLAADALMAVCDVALAVLLFVLFRPLAPLASLLAAVFRVVQAAVIAANLMHQSRALAFAFSDLGPQGDTLALLALKAQARGYDLGLLFFGVSGLLLGWIIVRQGAAPRLLGWLIGAAGAVYVTGTGLVFLAPAAAESFQPAYGLCVLAEVLFCLWLLLLASPVREAAAA